jgi:hypothetical protein
MAERIPDLERTHVGEQAVQALAGEGGQFWGSPMFDGDIPPAFAAFLQAQPVVFVGAPDTAGDMWCGVLGDRPGFAQVVDPRSVVLDALPPPGDPLREAFADDTDIGMIAIDFARRRRVRYNGRARRVGDTLSVTTEQVLGNCPKYIRPRLGILGDSALRAGAAEVTDRLTPGQMEWIGSVDTFFISSRAAGLGADASHRGGPPGFVSVAGATVITWPDFVGNSFYMTFGNAHLDDRAGVLFVDWETGTTLQLTGRLGLDWGSGQALRGLEAQRLVRFEVRRVVRIEGGCAVRWVDPTAR